MGLALRLFLHSTKGPVHVVRIECHLPRDRAPAAVVTAADDEIPDVVGRMVGRRRAWGRSTSQILTTRALVGPPARVPMSRATGTHGRAFVADSPRRGRIVSIVFDSQLQLLPDPKNRQVTVVTVVRAALAALVIGHTFRVAARSTPRSCELSQ